MKAPGTLGTLCPNPLEKLSSRCSSSAHCLVATGAHRPRRAWESFVAAARGEPAPAEQRLSRDPAGTPRSTGLRRFPSLPGSQREGRRGPFPVPSPRSSGGGQRVGAARSRRGGVRPRQEGSPRRLQEPLRAVGTETRVGPDRPSRRVSPAVSCAHLTPIDTWGVWGGGSGLSFPLLSAGTVDFRPRQSLAGVSPSARRGPLLRAPRAETAPSYFRLLPPPRRLPFHSRCSTLPEIPWSVIAANSLETALEPRLRLHGCVAGGARAATHLPGRADSWKRGKRPSFYRQRHTASGNAGCAAPRRGDTPAGSTGTAGDAAGGREGGSRRADAAGALLCPRDLKERGENGGVPSASLRQRRVIRARTRDGDAEASVLGSRHGAKYLSSKPHSVRPQSPTAPEQMLSPAEAPPPVPAPRAGSSTRPGLTPDPHLERGVFRQRFQVR